MEERSNPKSPASAGSAGVLQTAGRADSKGTLGPPPAGSIPVVGLGGSAGSLSALSSIAAKIPPDSGAAYVIVVHLAPEHDTMLPEILQRETSLPVKQVEGKVALEKDRIYVISPGKQLRISDGNLESLDLVRPKGSHVTIDVFFRTLAEACGVDSCAIVLSGGDGDGALGLKRVKERGGLTIVQDPAEAEFDGMPRSSIATGMVDWVLPAANIPARLADYWSNGRNLRLPMESEMESNDAATSAEADIASLQEILRYLDARCGHDFSNYKRATILRRVGRRMQVNGLSTLDEYLTSLQTDPGESVALLQDLLISVTNYFRDSSSFRALEDMVPSLFKDNTASSQLRVWVPACATGEEAYSIAMLLHEHAGKLTHPPSIQIFATDLDQRAIDIARVGIYPQTIVADVSEARLKRFFTVEKDGYRVKLEIRESVLFAMHDLLRDPPFSRLGLVSCRNLLIYLNREAQGKVMDIFHFALRPKGKLFLGSSESVDEITGLFEPIDKQHRIYVRKEAQRVRFPIPTTSKSLAFTKIRVNENAPINSDYGEHGEHGGDGGDGERVPHAAEPANLHLRLIERIAPPSIVVNRVQDIVHLSNSASKYLQISGGEPSANLLKLIHPDLRAAARALLFKALDTESAVKSRNIRLQAGGHTETVTITVESVEPESRDFFLVIFEDQGLVGQHDDDISEISPSEQSLVRHLEEELDQMRASSRDTVEQYETSVEELKASNEEMHAINKEMCSTTEEMETGREELQSINEEVITINQELKTKVEQLARANSDLRNLMASTKIATIFLDCELRIEFFTPSCTELFNLIASDHGRRLSDLSLNLVYPTFSQDAMDVLENLKMVEQEVKDTEGKWFLIRMSPYRSAEDQIVGVVITCIDITETKKNEEFRHWLSSIVEFSNDAVISFTLEGTVISWNKGAERIFGYTADEIIGKSQSILAPESLRGEKRELLRKLQRGELIEPFETVRICKDGKRIDVSLSASVVRDDSGKIVGATAIAQDISARKQKVEDLRQAHDDLEEKVAARTAELRKRVSELALMTSELTFAEERERKRMARILHDELQQLLVSVKMGIETLNRLDDEARKQEIQRLTKLMDDIFASSRLLAIDLSPPVLSETLGRALDWLCHTWMPEKHNLCVHTDIEMSLDARSEDIRSIVFYSVRELLFNVVKHSMEMEAYVDLVLQSDGNLKLTVRDHGLGFDLRALGSESAAATGFGLIGLRERLETLGGEFHVRSQPNEGVEAMIIIPGKTNEDE